MTFGEALEHVKRGKKAKRNGWNGKEQYIVLAYMQDCITASGVAISEPEHTSIGSKFLMFVGTSGYQCGWLASQADMLAEDWEIFQEDEHV